MKILQINKFWFPHGGADVYAIECSRILRDRGHAMMYFGMTHAKNLKTKYSEYFVSNPHISKSDYSAKGGMLQKLKSALKIIYSREAAQQLDKLLNLERPDIAHLHNIYHHLSPSILGVLRRHKIPVVHTLHDYKRLCPNHAMFTQNKICEQCKGRKYYNAVFNKCIFNSVAPSSVVAVEMTVQSMFGWYDTYIDRFIAPSEFMKQKMVEWGRPSDNIDVVPYPVAISKRHTVPGKNILYCGRLAPEKGIDIVLRCAEVFRDITFDIVGDGPMRLDIERRILEKNLKNVKMYGMLSREEVNQKIRQCAFLLIPSQWYENYPLSLLEAFAEARGAIGSRVGGIPEIIHEGKNGFLFDHTNVDDCIDKIRKLWYDRELVITFGMNAREQVSRVNGEEQHYEHLIKIYKQTIF